MKRKGQSTALIVVLALNIALAGYFVASFEDQDPGKCGSAVDSLGVDLSSLRPTWNPRDIPDYISSDNVSAPYFNANSDNPEVICGDERRFLLLREAGTGEAYSRTIVLEPSKKYEAYIFFKNDASFQDYETDSRNTRVRLKVPNVVANPVAFEAVITSDNAVVPSTFSSAVAEPRIGSKFPYIEVASAILNDSEGRKIADLSIDSLTDSQGVLVGCTEADGHVPAGCSGSITVSFSTKKSSFDARISSAYNDPDGPWNNSIRIGSTHGFWIRYRYRNVGEVPHDGVTVRLWVPSTFPFLRGSDSEAYLTGSNRTRRAIEHAELWSEAGVNLERLAVNESAEIHIPFTVEDGWLQQICETNSESTWITAETTVPGYYASTANFFIYPADDMCSGG
ncbi:Uncharacterised protein [Mycolicibacterium vanbaalenii]|uniref:Uncharacterized protein n=1 Tax=Mycolicibacterium vanbaalenii TaxID=110539 RepID=A0A5S9R9C7_MYCVN|nr:hypothetical protein [Mycolicibacterium vanbaalenii]CAA0134723.1 Uncharacterised protein [Mycolicibacterium vanbaalenii]